MNAIVINIKLFTFTSMRRFFIFSVSILTLLLVAIGVNAETITQDTATARNLGLYGGQVRYIAVDNSRDYIYIGTHAERYFYFE